MSWKIGSLFLSMELLSSVLIKSNGNALQFVSNVRREPSSDSEALLGDRFKRSIPSHSPLPVEPQVGRNAEAPDGGSDSMELADFSGFPVDKKAAVPGVLHEEPAQGKDQESVEASAPKEEESRVPSEPQEPEAGAQDLKDQNLSIQQDVASEPSKAVSPEPAAPAPENLDQETADEDQSSTAPVPAAPLDSEDPVPAPVPAAPLDSEDHDKSGNAVPEEVLQQDDIGKAVVDVGSIPTAAPTNLDFALARSQLCNQAVPILSRTNAIKGEESKKDFGMFSRMTGTSEKAFMEVVSDDPRGNFMQMKYSQSEWVRYRIHNNEETGQVLTLLHASMRKNLSPPTKVEAKLSTLSGTTSKDVSYLSADKLDEIIKFSCASKAPAYIFVYYDSSPSHKDDNFLSDLDSGVNQALSMTHAIREYRGKSTQPFYYQPVGVFLSSGSYMDLTTEKTLQWEGQRPHIDMKEMEALHDAKSSDGFLVLKKMAKPNAKAKEDALSKLNSAYVSSDSFLGQQLAASERNIGNLEG